MRTLNKIIDACLLALAGIAGVIVLLLLLSVAFATLSRYLFNEPYAFLIDFASYSLVYIAFLGAPWLYSKRGHVSIDMLVNALPKKVKPGWIAGTDVAVFIVCAVTCVISFQVTMTAFEKGVIVADFLSTPKWILIAPMPLSTFFLAIQAIRNAVSSIRPKATVEGGIL